MTDIPTEDDTTTLDIERLDINYPALGDALLRLLSAFEKPDWVKLAANNGMGKDELCGMIPYAVGSDLTEQCLELLMAPADIGEFVNKGIDTICEIAAAIVSLTAESDPRYSEALIKSLCDYGKAPAGSAGEVLAQRKIDEATTSINDDILRRNSSLVVGFADEDIGYSASATETLVANANSGDDDDDDSEDEDETALNGLKGRVLQG